MNLSASIMLVNEAVRPVKVEYDPDNKYNNAGAMSRFFKSFDKSLKKDDYVIVPTSTRHGMTVCKVTEVDFVVDFNSGEKWDWIIGKVDKAGYDNLLKQEEQVIHRVGKSQENKMRLELKAAMGLEHVDFTDLDVMQAPALSSPLPKQPPVAPMSDTDPSLEPPRKAPRPAPPPSPRYSDDDESPF